jgi:hypothetical protein
MLRLPGKSKALAAGLGSASLVAALLDYRVLLMIVFVMIVFWCGVGSARRLVSKRKAT